MPLVPYVLQSLRRWLGELGLKGGRAAAFSCPDLIAGPKDLQAFLGRRIRPAEAAWRPDSPGIIGWHKQEGRLRRIFDTWRLFKLAGWALDCFDLHPGRGREIVADLSEPLPGKYHGQYGLVVDIIANQTFAPGEAFRNAVRLARPGGLICHHLPISMVNQGYWGVSPCLLEDFYAFQGCRTLELRIVRDVYELKEEIPYSAQRMRNLGDDAMVLGLFERGPGPLKHGSPVMAKFRESPACLRQPRLLPKPERRVTHGGAPAPA